MQIRDANNMLFDKQAKEGGGLQRTALEGVAFLRDWLEITSLPGEVFAFGSHS